MLPDEAGFYSDQKTVNHFGRGWLHHLVLGLPFCSDDTGNADSKAAFAAAILRRFVNATVTAGVRYSEERKHRGLPAGDSTGTG